MAQAIFTILVYFLVMRQVVATLGLEGLGLWSLTMSLVAFARMLDLGGTGVLARLVATASGEEKQQAQFIDSATIASTLGFSSVAVVGYFVLQPILFNSIEPRLQSEAATLLFGLLLLLPLNALGLVHLGALDGIGRADIRAGIAIIALLVYSTSTLMLIQRHGVMALVYGQFLQHVFTSIAARGLLRHLIGPLGSMPLNFSRARLLEAVSFGVRLQLTAIPMAVFDPLCRLMIGRSVGLDLLGIYELASKFAASSRTVVQAFANPV
ncbi:MAG: oligosaccharide flippase family protein, partial [Erythrobacter sp.]|nr:oligosaccharide flippase family protein [Erythrobacter sp.]